MSDDASLDDFFDERESDDAEVDAHAGGGDALAPADPTYEWQPDGARCAECGEAVERRWRGDGGPVCVDCKDW